MATRPSKMYVVTSTEKAYHDFGGEWPLSGLGVRTVFESLLKANQAARKYIARRIERPFVEDASEDDSEDDSEDNSEDDVEPVFSCEVEINAGSSTECYAAEVCLGDDGRSDIYFMKVKEVNVGWASLGGPVGQAPNGGSSQSSKRKKT